jgi:hypothetical protein
MSLVVVALVVAGKILRATQLVAQVLLGKVSRVVTMSARGLQEVVAVALGLLAQRELLTTLAALVALELIGNRLVLFTQVVVVVLVVPV